MSEIQMLICSANVGNAEPTPESLAAWVPNDGEVTSVLDNTKYPLRGTEDKTVGAGAGCASGDNEEKGDGAKTFDIIAIGMQEATFEKNDANKKLNSSSIESNEDSRNSDDGEKQPETSNDKPTSSSAGKPPGKMNEGHEKTNKTVRAAHKPTKTPVKLLRNVTATEDHTHQAHRTPVGVLKSAIKSVISTKKQEDNAEEINKKPVKSAAESYGYDTKVLHRLIAKRCPSYEVKVSCLRGQMRLTVLVRKDIAEEVEDVDVNFENTGIGAVLANKGGIIATLTIRRTRLAFMTAHLEAHEGKKHYEGRCENLASILNGAKVGKSLKRFDASIASHHFFVFGDLNYRTVLPGMDTTPEDHIREGFRLVDSKKWDVLNDCDELSKAVKNGDCLVGFETLFCNFPPTFKVKREKGIVYNPQRTPSYTDRILWKSADGFKEHVKSLLYEPCIEYITSDHKPIRGAFSVVTNVPKPLNRPKPSGGINILRFRNAPTQNRGEPRTIKLSISNLKCTDLTPMDYNGKSDPYIKCIVDPRELLLKQKASWPSTNVIKSNVNPDWKDETIQMVLLLSSDEVDYAGAMLFIKVKDYDLHSKDDLIGTVSMSLTKLCSRFLSKKYLCEEKKEKKSEEDNVQTFDIDRPVLQNGQVQGNLKCRITVREVEDESAAGALQNDKKEKKKKKEKRKDG